MTPDEARDLFSAAYDGELDAERRAAFDAALEADADLRTEWEGFRAMLDEAHSLDADEGPTPDLLAGVQTRLRERSRGRFYRDRFATRSSLGRSVFPILLGLVMLLVVVIAWLAMNYIDVEPAAVDGPSAQPNDG